MAGFLHTMVRVTDPEKSRAFYEALGFRFSRDLDIVRGGSRRAGAYRSRPHERAVGGAGTFPEVPAG
jgi:catechol 2,3-dioxygenase-like lactoylglutathione lyase family enzyme